jgi:hypothetical protein
VRAQERRGRFRRCAPGLPPWSGDIAGTVGTTHPDEPGRGKKAPGDAAQKAVAEKGKGTEYPEPLPSCRGLGSRFEWGRPHSSHHLGPPSQGRKGRRVAGDGRRGVYALHGDASQARVKCKRRTGGSRIFSSNPMDQDLETRLKNLRQAPRCGARTRAGTACQRPAIRGRKRCRLHGGLSPGAPRGRKNGNFRNGNWTAEAIEERRWLRSLVQLFTTTG